MNTKFIVSSLVMGFAYFMQGFLPRGHRGGFDDPRLPDLLCGAAGAIGSRRTIDRVRIDWSDAARSDCRWPNK